MTAWPSREDFRQMSTAEVNRFFVSIDVPIEVIDTPVCDCDECVTDCYEPPIADSKLCRECTDGEHYTE